MDANILNVTQRALEDNSIVNSEKHTYIPYSSTTYNHNDEIRIRISQQDIYTLPWSSLIYIEGRITKEDGSPSTNVKFVNNGIAFLFQEIRYEINGTVIDKVRNPGITSTIKSYISYGDNESKALRNAGWYACSKQADDLIDEQGYFNVCIPLRMMLGFVEDFHKIIMNLRQELILIRSSTDVNALISTDKDERIKLNLEKIEWKIPHISVADAERLMLLNLVNANAELQVAYRSWELFEYPLLQQTQKHTWAIKTTSQLEKPRFVIFGLQTGAKNDILKNMSIFNDCNLTNVKLYLNSEVYPYDNLNLNFTKNYFAMLYHMYTQFQSSYYGQESGPVMTPKQFKEFAPLAVIDCSHQNEILKSANIDLRLDFDTQINIPNHTTAYCLVIHDKICTYSPTTSIVRVL